MLYLLFWRILALFFVLLGLIGVIVPGMPTTVFMLLAAWASGKGWPALNAWLLAHPKFGPPINNWYQHHAIPRKAKYFATATMLLSMGILCLTVEPLWVKWCIPSLMTVILLWLCTRPEGPALQPEKVQ